MFIEYKGDVSKVILKAEIKLKQFLLDMQNVFSGKILIRADMTDEYNTAFKLDLDEDYISLITRTTLNIGHSVYITVVSRPLEDGHLKLEILVMCKDRGLNSNYYVGNGDYVEAIACIKTDLIDSGFTSIDQMLQV